MSSNKRQKTEEEKDVVIIYKEGVEVPANVTKVIFDASVTEVSIDSFRDCKQLKEVVFNDGLRRIGNWAFCGCTSLKWIKLPSTVTVVGVNAFHNCTNLREVILNEGLREIVARAFYCCSSLAIIKLPSTVTKIGESAFDGCTNLREVVLNEGLQKIWALAFCNCTSLTIIKLNEGLQKIWYNAFCGCSSLERLTLPSTLNEIRSNAFRSCTNLREVILNEGLQEIEIGAFHDCASLTVVKFPAISKRAKNLIKAGQTDVEDKITIYQNFEWGGDEFLVSPEAICNDNWVAVRNNLDQLLPWISYYELKEATTLFELSLWKANIEKMGAITKGERSACRADVPGPAKDAILQYLQHTDDD